MTGRYCLLLMVLVCSRDHLAEVCRGWVDWRRYWGVEESRVQFLLIDLRPSMLAVRHSGGRRSSQCSGDSNAIRPPVGAQPSETAAVLAGNGQAGRLVRLCMQREQGQDGRVSQFHCRWWFAVGEGGKVLIRAPWWAGFGRIRGSEGSGRQQSLESGLQSKWRWPRCNSCRGCSEGQRGSARGEERGMA